MRLRNCHGTSRVKWVALARPEIPSQALVRITIPLMGKIDLHIHYTILLLQVVPFGRIMG